jgi:hypothetical protein
VHRAGCSLHARWEKHEDAYFGITQQICIVPYTVWTREYLLTTQLLSLQYLLVLSKNNVRLKSILIIVDAGIGVQKTYYIWKQEASLNFQQKWTWSACFRGNTMRETSVVAYFPFRKNIHQVRVFLPWGIKPTWLLDCSPEAEQIQKKESVRVLWFIFNLRIKIGQSFA